MFAHWYLYVQCCQINVCLIDWVVFTDVGVDLFWWRWHVDVVIRLLVDFCFCFIYSLYSRFHQCLGVDILMFTLVNSMFAWLICFDVVGVDSLRRRLRIDVWIRLWHYCFCFIYSLYYNCLHQCLCVDIWLLRLVVRLLLFLTTFVRWRLDVVMLWLLFLRRFFNEVLV